MAATSLKKLEQQLASLHAAPGGCESAAARQLLLNALASRHAAAITHAAEIVTGHTLEGFAGALHGAFYALLGEDGAKLDPGASAKEAVLIALEQLEDSDAEVFAAAATCMQRERAKGGVRESAAGVRIRGVLGLARLGHADILPMLGACLGDRDAGVRVAAARAVAHRGQRAGAGLLLLRMGAGDDTPEVLSECLRGLFAIAPDLAVEHARAALRDTHGDAREQTLHALGSVPDDAAVTLLAEQLAEHGLAEERRPVIEALGLSLRPSARAHLLALVEGDRASDAEAALEALAVHRYDARLGTQLRERTGHSRVLSQRVRELFSAPED